jgi:hypothetical protein
MRKPPPKLILLGPQRLLPTLDRAIDSLGVTGRIAAVTAGWEERESEDQELREHLGGRTLNLAAHARAEDVLQSDPELGQALRARHDTLRRVQELYRMRLVHAMEAARELLRRRAANALAPALAVGAANDARAAQAAPVASEVLRSAIDEECGDAIRALRELDAHHLRRVRAVHEEFEARWRPFERAAVARHRDELKAALGECEALCIAGGHVTILLNRLRLFGIVELARALPIVAWSAGAMVLGERIVLFHDSPPQGAGDPEVLEIGIGRYAGVLPLPHADKRLRLTDAARVALFARRFEPDRCALLTSKTRLDWDGAHWSAHEDTRRLASDGSLCWAGTP